MTVIAIGALVALVNYCAMAFLASLPEVLNKQSSFDFAAFRLLGCELNLLGVGDSPEVIYLSLTVLALIGSSLGALISNVSADYYLHYREAALTRLIYRNYLLSDYLTFAQIPNAQKEKEVLIDSRELTSYVISPIIRLLLSSVIVFGIVISLIYVLNVKVLLVLAAIILIYALIIAATLRPVRKISDMRLAANENKSRFASDAFKNIEILKIFNITGYYMEQMRLATNRYAKVVVISKFVTTSMKPLLEIVILSATLIFVIWQTERLPAVIADLGMIASAGFAAYRVLPHVQTVYSSVVNLAFSGALASGSLNARVPTADLHDIVNLPSSRATEGLIEKSKIDALVLENVSFCYQNETQNALQDLSLRFERGEMYIVQGESGCGKSTLLQLITGLIEPQKGRIYAVQDGRKVDVATYRQYIGYAPQQSSVITGTLVENVALTDIESVIDESFANECIERVGLVDINVRLGGRPLNPSSPGLSGGQLQRLAIARALYARPQILVLDESTNAMDPSLERDILENLAKQNDKIIIMVSHGSLPAGIRARRITIADH